MKHISYIHMSFEESDMANLKVPCFSPYEAKYFLFIMQISYQIQKHPLLPAVRNVLLSDARYTAYSELIYFSKTSIRISYFGRRQIVE